LKRLIDKYCNVIQYSNMSAFQMEQPIIIAEQERVSFLNGTTRSLSKGQDFVAFGKEKDYDWVVLLDGHGTNSFINLMRVQNWREIMATEDPCETLLTIIKNKRYNYGANSGSTLLMMRAYADYIETVSIGDSKVIIYKNEEVVYKSTEHNTKNPLEIERLKQRVESGCVEFDRCKNPIALVVSATKMVPCFPDYVRFENGTYIAPTQALGHNDITGYAPEKRRENYERGERVRCILASDGYSEMHLFESECEEEKEKDEKELLELKAEELAEKAEKRWRQAWDWHWDEKNPEVFIKTEYGSNMDDVGIVIWDNTRAV